MGKRKFGGNANYTNYISGPRWAKKREEFFLLNEKRCAACRSTLCLHVHHMTYERFGDELLEDLLCLCDFCHEVVHKYHRMMLNSGATKAQRTMSLKDATLACVEIIKGRKAPLHNPRKKPYEPPKRATIGRSYQPWDYGKGRRRKVRVDNGK